MTEPVTILPADRAFSYEHRSVQHPVTREQWMNGDYDGLQLVRQTAAFRTAVIEQCAQVCERMDMPDAAAAIRQLKTQEPQA